MVQSAGCEPRTRNPVVEPCTLHHAPWTPAGFDTIQPRRL